MSYELDQVLASTIQSLANFFGTTTEIVMKNAPIWLAKYGWCITIRDLPLSILLGATLSIIIAFPVLMIFFDGDFSCKAYKKIIIILGAIIIFISVLIPIISCMIAPEIVGLEALITK